MLAITIVLTEGYSDWEIGVLAGTGRAYYGADIGFVSADGGPVTAVSGLKTEALERFSAPTGGVVVVCGGPAFESETPPEIEGRLKQAHENGCVIAGICGATLALARTGLRIITAPAPAPASFAAEVLTAAGLEAEAAGVIMAMLSQEHARVGS